MSKEFEITSCSECPNSKYSMKTMDMMCEILPINERTISTVELQDSGTEIWSECPLEDYHAEEYDFKSSVPVINRHALNKACGTSKNIVPVREALAEIRAEREAETQVKMKELVVLLEYSSYTEYYYAPDGNSYASHPAKLNEFIQRVSESGGNILSMQIVPDQQKYSIHYQVPIGTYPISV